MRALCLACLLIAAPIMARAAPGVVAPVAQQPGPDQKLVPAPKLIDVLMGKFDAMNAAKQGIFHEDVSATVAPYFPPGQPFRESQRVVAAQKLGALRPFKGAMTAADDPLYVTQFSLMSAMFSDVSVVLHLEFAGRSEADMVVKKATAFLRAGTM